MHKTAISTTFDKPKFISWKVVAGNPKLHILNLYDVILDEQDLKIRKMDKTGKFMIFC